MRPARLEVEGFTTFRHPVVVDFDGADLFAFVGATGSGKSSLIDAIVFALYGSIPRLEDRRVVAPVVSAQAQEARVRLDFSVAGDQYTAVRVVRRGRSGGASTKEARLERRADGEVLAGTAEEVSEAVEALLGLGFDHFTKCVVLPQGQFQRLLHDNPGDRQKLLVSLLDLGLYKAMAQAAGRREQQAQREAEIAEALLADRAAATPERRDEAAARVEVVSALRQEVAAARPRLDELRTAEADAVARRDEAERRHRQLRSVTVPERLADRGMLLVEARDAAKLAEAAGEEAAEALDAAEQHLAGLADRSVVERALRAHDDRARLEPSIGELEARLGSAVEAAGAVLADHAAADRLVADTTAAVERARWEHRAHDLRASLVAGEPCPVCRQTVHEHPGDEPVDEITAAESARTAAEEALVAVAKRLRAAEAERSRAEADLAVARERMAQLDAELADQPSRGELAAVRDALDAAEASLKDRRVAERAARKAAVGARGRVGELQRQMGDDRRRFSAARDAVAALGPPPTGDDDLVGDWEDLAAWAEEEGRAQQRVARDAADAVATVMAGRGAVIAELTIQMEAAGVDPSAGEPWEAVGEALAAARHALEALERDLQQADEHRAAAERHRRAAAVAQELARHLSARGFEKWVLDEALSLLVAGATETLLELSAGAYSLGLDERSNFEVVDHRNADERRLARTLSGGETFLASLALALALSDQLSRLAVNGAARLESIFLDEGFGALDAETLDTVAAAIEELGSQGRTVGLVSHVAELAERVPVRFEVTKGPATSTVERVEV